MTRCSLPRLRAVIAVTATVLLSLLAVNGFAQVQTGNIFGKVQAKDGSILPGVTVTLTGVGAPKTFVTDAQGNFRFLNLSPGTYALKAELSGYGTSTRSGLTVGIGRNVDVAMTLAPTVAETITVTAEAPLLDVRKTGTGSNVPKIELEKIPTARDPWVILQQTPSVLMDRANVGGNESGQQSIYVSKGTSGQQSTWNVDGVSITDFGATGSSPTYYDFEAFEEMQITTSGTDPRIQTPGVQINIVTKRGTNDFRGSGRYLLTDRDYQADPEIPSEASAYLLRVNEINQIVDRGAEIGGPIIRDRLWFWAAYGEQNIDILSASIIAGSRFVDKTVLKNYNVKLNAQPFSSNSFTFVDQYGAKIKQGRNVGPTRPPETAWNQNSSFSKGTGSLTDPSLWKIEDTQIFGPNLYLTGLYSEVQGGFQLIADNGKGCSSFECGLDSLPAYRDRSPTGDNAWHRTYLNYKSIRPQTQYRLDGSTFFDIGGVNNELKFGFGYRDASVTSSTAWAGGQYIYHYGPGAVGDGTHTGFVGLMRIPTFTYEAKQTDLYVGDTIMFGNLTVQAGLRYDIQKGSTLSGRGEANPVAPDILPAYTFPAVSGLKWTDISPRLGITYTLGADRKTLLRAGYSRYVNQLNSGSVFAVSPGSASYVYYYFTDRNGDKIAQRSEIDFNYGAFFWRGFDPANPTATTQRTRWASDFSAPTTDEFVFGAEHELLTDFSVGANVTWRKLDNFIWTIGEKTRGAGDYYSSADYVQAPAVTATLPNGQTRQLTYFTLKPGVSPPRFFVIDNRPDYSQEYRGLELTATKRMSNRWMLRGNLTLQDWTQDVGPGAIVDPSRVRTAAAGCQTCDGSQVLVQSGGSGNKGSVWIGSKWAYSVTGVYQIPVVETTLGFNLNGRQGYPRPYTWLVRGAAGEGTKALLATNDTDELRNENVTTLDLRLARDFRISRVGITVSIDGFNILNSNTILQRDANQLNAAAGSTTLRATRDRVIEVLSPRVFRLGARLTF